MEIPVYTKYNISTFEMHARRKKIADIRSDASEVFHYDIPDYPMQYRKNHICAEWDFSDISIHWHDEIEIIYVKKGMGTVNVDFKQYTVTAPSIVLIFPGQLHSIAQFENERMEYENIIFN